MFRAEKGCYTLGTVLKWCLNGILVEQTSCSTSLLKISFSYSCAIHWIVQFGISICCKHRELLFTNVKFIYYCFYIVLLYIFYERKIYLLSSAASTVESLFSHFTSIPFWRRFILLVEICQLWASFEQILTNFTTRVWNRICLEKISQLGRRTI